MTKAHGFLDGNKRTTGIASTVLMELNGYQLVYPWDIKKDTNKFAEIIDNTAANLTSKDELIHWFDLHKQEKNERKKRKTKKTKKEKK